MPARSSGRIEKFERRSTTTRNTTRSSAAMRPKNESPRLYHPPMQAGWVDAPHSLVNLGAFTLESGEVLEDFSVSFAVHGDLQDKTRPVVVVLCAIGSTHHRLDFLIGPGRAIDPKRTHILAIDAIGNGLTTSPSNSRRQPGMKFPRFTIRDMVLSQKRLLDRLGIENAAAVIGASMGGMQALQWAVSYPDFSRRIVALTPMARTTPWAAAINDAARQNLMARLSKLEDCAEYPSDIWDGWVSVMQLLAMRTPIQVDQEMRDASGFRAWLQKQTAWWKRQNFDPVDWIYQSWAYDSHDVGTTPGFNGDTVRSLRSIDAPTLIAAPRLDLYNSTEAARWAASLISHCEYFELDTIWGHLMASSTDSVSARFLNAQIRKFLHNNCDFY